MESLPPRQQQLLELLARDVRAGRTPVVSDLIQALGLAGESSLTHLLTRFESKGFITVQSGGRGRQRVIGLTPRGKMQAGLGLPVLGCIPAGPLQEAIEEAEDWIDNLYGLLPCKPGDFLLRVDGDSMIGDGILPNDKVLLRPGIQVSNGEIAAVQIEEEGEVCATLKHVHFRVGGKTIRLRASNPKYDDMSLPAGRVSIAGVYRGLVRSAVV
jgi:repressor LexA